MQNLTLIVNPSCKIALAFIIHKPAHDWCDSVYYINPRPTGSCFKYLINYSGYALGFIIYHIKHEQVYVYYNLIIRNSVVKPTAGLAMCRNINYKFTKIWNELRKHSLYFRYQFFIHSHLWSETNEFLKHSIKTSNVVVAGNASIQLNYIAAVNILIDDHYC